MKTYAEVAQANGLKGIMAKIYWERGNQVRNQVWNQVGNQVWNQVRTQVGELFRGGEYSFNDLFKMRDALYILDVYGKADLDLLREIEKMIEEKSILK